jgi:hypothetical protein
MEKKMLKTSLLGVVAAGVLSFVGCSGTPADDAKVTCKAPDAAGITALDKACAKLIDTTKTKAACEDLGGAGYTVCQFSGTDGAADAKCAAATTSSGTVFTPKDACTGTTDNPFDTYATCAKGGLAVAGNEGPVGCGYDLK